MISLIEALGYRCLRYVRQPLGEFHVLVGPNGSGKTTFLDVVAFLGDLVSDGPEAAIEKRTRNFQDLVWGRTDGHVELAIEAKIPEDRHELLAKNERFLDTIRFEISLGPAEGTGEVGILEEIVLLKSSASEAKAHDSLPAAALQPTSITVDKGPKGCIFVVIKNQGVDQFRPEVREKEQAWPRLNLGPRKSALANLPEDESLFPASTWLKELLKKGVRSLAINESIRRASPSGRRRTFEPDGSSLPWLVAELKEKSPGRFADWVRHLQTTLSDLEGIDTIEREDERSRYLVLLYSGGLRVPSWMASDGTLRLLALTLLAYLQDFQGVYLIEEPENGIHPRAIETLFQSLSSAYDAQILVATHSPIILNVTRPEQILCFQKQPGDERGPGSTVIVSGDEHPALKDWQRDVSLGDLFAAGVLG